jgi:hypothetical protein
MTMSSEALAVVGETGLTDKSSAEAALAIRERLSDRFHRPVPSVYVDLAPFVSHAYRSTKATALVSALIGTVFSGVVATALLLTGVTGAFVSLSAFLAGFTSGRLVSLRKERQLMAETESARHEIEQRLLPSRTSSG